LVARWFHNPEVAGSNPVPATKLIRNIMKIVDIRDFNRVVAQEYMGSPVMYIYHNQDEFRKSPFYKTAIILSGPKDFMQYLSDNGLSGTEKSIHLSDKNVWIKTNDKYIPDTWTTKGDINFKIFPGAKLEKTDGCYIQLISVFAGRGFVKCYTSSGVYNASLTRWSFSGAVKPQYRYEVSTNYNYTRAGGFNTYKAKLKKILSKSAGNSDLVRISHLIINPNSDCFLDPEKAAYKVLKNRGIKKADVFQVFKQHNFKKTFIKEILMLDNSFRSEMKGAFNKEKIEGMFNEMWNIATKSVEKGNATVKDLREIMGDILDVSHRSEDISTQNPPQHLLPGQKPAEQLIGMVDDTHLVTQGDSEEDEKKKQREEDKEFEKIKEDVGAVDYGLIGEDEQSDTSKD
jgi:hypothetical protein